MDPSSESLPHKRQPALIFGSVLPWVLFAAYFFQCAWFIRTQSLTYDEPVHIAEGLDAWRNHRFEKWNDHPSLPRLWLTLPLRDRRWQMNVEPLPTEGWRVTSLSPDSVSISNRARYMNVILGLILAVIFWVTAKRLISRAAANLGLALLVFSPSVIAHFSLATTDGAATLATFAVASYLIYWKTHPTIRSTICFGLLLGLLLLAKFSTPVMFVVALFWVLVLDQARFTFNPARWNFGKAITAAIVAFVVAWAGYFFHVSQLTIREHRLTATFPNRPPVIYENVRTNLNLSLYVPAGEYIEGFRNVIRRNRLGQRAFFLGEVSRQGGFKLYYPAVVILKWPLVVLCLFGLAVVLICLRRVAVPSDMTIMSSFGAVYFLVAVWSRFDIGERHILPVYPFVILITATVAEYSRKHRKAGVVLTLIVLAGFADVFRYAPDYLSYFNIFVKQAQSYRFLSDSNLDWGQGLIALCDYERAHPDEPISLAYFGSVDPAVYGLHAKPLAEGERARGTVVVSATHLSGQYLENPEAYHWLLRYPLTRVLDHSLYVFQVHEEAESPERPR